MQSARVLLACLLLMLAKPAASQPVRWWSDPTLQQELRLSPNQIAALEREYSSTLELRRALRRSLDRAQAELADALAEGTLSDREAEALASRVADAQRRRNVTRTAMLFRMYRHLSPHQRRILMAHFRTRR